MSFSKMFCDKSPFKKADVALIEGAKDAVEKVENPYENISNALNIGSDAAKTLTDAKEE